jgi:hypothetical protein
MLTSGKKKKNLKFLSVSFLIFNLIWIVYGCVILYVVRSKPMPSMETQNAISDKILSLKPESDSKNVESIYRTSLATEIVLRKFIYINGMLLIFSALTNIIYVRVYRNTEQTPVSD